MNTTRAFVYGSISEESDGARCPLGADLPEDADDGASRGMPAEDMDLPCDDCPEAAGSGGPDGVGRRERRNGEVWWRDYEAPERSIEDFTTRELGIHGEMLAARYLASRGMEILEQNWRSKAGEVDIVARDPDGEVALVEVKTRLDLHGDPQCMPELAVDGAKQRRYRRIALIYLMCHPEVVRMRFDVIAINILDRHNARLRHLLGAFSWDS